MIIETYYMGIIGVGKREDFKRSLSENENDAIRSFLEAAECPYVRRSVIGQLFVVVITADRVKHGPEAWRGRGPRCDALNRAVDRAEIVRRMQPFCAAATNDTWTIRKNALQLMFAQAGYNMFDGEPWKFLKETFGEIFCRGFEAAARALNEGGGGPLQVPPARMIADLQKKIRDRHYNSGAAI